MMKAPMSDLVRPLTDAEIQERHRRTGERARVVVRYHGKLYLVHLWRSWLGWTSVAAARLR
jgi:hypothetical protein